MAQVFRHRNWVILDGLNTVRILVIVVRGDMFTSSITEKTFIHYIQYKHPTVVYYFVYILYNPLDIVSAMVVVVTFI